jgi:hypothetical protein
MVQAAVITGRVPMEASLVAEGTVRAVAARAVTVPGAAVGIPEEAGNAILEAAELAAALVVAAARGETASPCGRRLPSYRRLVRLSHLFS